jgi:hypothetical protein
MEKKGIYFLSAILLLSFFVAKTSGQQPSFYSIARMSFNSDAFSEISPVIVKDGIIFCSDRRFSGIKDRTAFDGRRLYNLYHVVRKDSSDWGKANELKSERDSKFNSGPLSIASDNQTVYFTSEVETGKAAKKKNFVNRNGIFIADLAGSDLISIRPFKYNNPQYNVGQPSVSSDGKYLYFTSDMPGGQGGTDIYYCKLVNGEWAEPVNPGPKINSYGDEGFSFIHPSGRLYFTSNRSGGFGKRDIYYTSLTNGKWDDPVHLPEPINSTFDDFAFVSQDNMQKGYFSSNRRNSDDVYEFSSLLIRKASCDTLVENSYCFRFVEENAIKIDSMPFRYEWKFGDGTRESGIVVEHCYEGPGTYLVQLDVINLITKEVMHNQKSDTLVITAIEQPYISSPDRIDAGKIIKLSADSTNLPGWNITRYYWNFGDESIGIGKEIDHTFLKAGNYNIQLIVSTDPEPGGTSREACISKNIIVIPKP